MNLDNVFGGVIIDRTKVIQKSRLLNVRNRLLSAKIRGLDARDAWAGSRLRLQPALRTP